MKQEILKRAVADCDLSLRAINCLRMAGIETVGDLCRTHKVDLLRVRCIGKKTLHEIQVFLSTFGLNLGMTEEEQLMAQIDTDVVHKVPTGGMTRREFVQRACISMAARVVGTNGIADSGDWANVVSEAEALAEELEKNGYGWE